MATKQEHPGEVVWIQYLRGYAALAVVSYHILQKAAVVGYTGSPHQFLATGVDVFFVISGFVIWYAQARQPERGPVEFFTGRITRIVPLYWAITLFVATMLLVWPSALGSSKLELAHAVKSLFFIPAMHPVAGDYFPLVILGWTLNYEMFFYALFALGIGIAGPRQGRLFAVVAIPLVILMFGAWFYPAPGAFQIYTRTVVIEFVFGMGLSILYLSGRVPRSIWWFTLAIAGLIILMILTGSTYQNRGLRWGIAAAMIVGGAIFSPAPRLAVLRWLGDISYSLYLSHFIVLSAVGVVWNKLGLAAYPDAAPLFMLAALAAALMLGHLSWRFVEKPGTRLAKRLLDRKRRVAATPPVDAMI